VTGLVVSPSPLHFLKTFFFVKKIFVKIFAKKDFFFWRKQDFFFEIVKVISSFRNLTNKIFLKMLKMRPSGNFNLKFIGLYHQLDGVTNPKYKFLHFLTTKFFAKRGRCQLLTAIGAAI
jgi:hypothetical protein